VPKVKYDIPLPSCISNRLRCHKVNKDLINLIYIDDHDDALASLRLACEFGALRPGIHVNTSVGKTALYAFPTEEDREVFETLLQREGIAYAYEVPERQLRAIPPVLIYSKGVFHNDASMVGFISGYGSVDSVIEADQRELQAIGGSFGAISDRMAQILQFANSITYPSYGILEDMLRDASDTIAVKYGLNWQTHLEAMKELGRLRNRIVVGNAPQTRLDDKVCVTSNNSTRGMQWCPFEGCTDPGWNEVVTIFNPHTERAMTINRGTEHLVRVHNLLEKGNEYGTTAKDFYDNFMPK
jgi:hypothetical protein